MNGPAWKAEHCSTEEKWQSEAVKSIAREHLLQGYRHWAMMP